MLAHILILILWLPLTFLSSAVECLFSEDELCEMGIRIGDPLAPESFMGQMQAT